MDRWAAPRCRCCRSRSRWSARRPPPAAPSDPNAAARRDYELAAAGRHQGNLGCVPGAPRHRLLCRSRPRTARQVRPPPPTRWRRARRRPRRTPPAAPRAGATQPRRAAVIELGDSRRAPAGGAPSPIVRPVRDGERLVHAELRRLGCYPGAVDASWGSGSRRALEQFNKHAGQKLDTQVASLDTLGVLRAKPTRVCPLECKTGYRAENEACVKIVCRAGFVVGDDGECERKAEGQDSSRPEPREPASRSAPRRQQYGAAGAITARGREAATASAVDRHVDPAGTTSGLLTGSCCHPNAVF